jgi:hypothetical protein
MISQCPGCGFHNLHVSRPRYWEERIAGLVGLCHFRCRRCRRRFLRQIVLLPNIRFARCPKCLRQELTDWSERYNYPAGFSSFWVWMGAGEHRCESCRHNFVSFFGRRPEGQPAKPPAPIAAAGEAAYTRRRFPAKVRVVARWRTPELFPWIANLPKWKVRIVWVRKETGAGWAGTDSRVPADS